MVPSPALVPSPNTVQMPNSTGMVGSMMRQSGNFSNCPDYFSIQLNK